MHHLTIKNTTTENINSNSNNIDELEVLDIIKIINTEDQTLALLVKNEFINIEKAINMILFSLKNKGRLIYIGAGTSGRLGVLDASEMPPTYNVNKNLVIGIIAGGNTALRNSIENAEDNEDLGKKDLEKIKLSNKDIVIGIAASGRTPYVIGALNYANKVQAQTISIACVKNSAIGLVANHKIEIDTKAEVISGSTRMKAGTAQKMVLNMISTTVMIKLGKVYNNLMVDVKASNFKLQQRSIFIFTEITDASKEIAQEYLSKTQYNVKLACLMYLKNINIFEAKKLLKKYNGFLKMALNHNE
jgi:N-acetylmuramic acid 6-phosphate etherase